VAAAARAGLEQHQVFLLQAEQHIQLLLARAVLAQAAAHLPQAAMAQILYLVQLLHLAAAAAAEIMVLLGQTVVLAAAEPANKGRLEAPQLMAVLAATAL